MASRKTLAGAVLSVIITVGYSASAMSADKCLRVLSSFLYPQVPNSVQTRLEPVIVHDAFRWWEAGESRVKLSQGRKLEEWVKSRGPDGQMLVVDLETWPVVGNSQIVGESVSRLAALSGQIKAHGFTEKVGFYGLLPVRDYWRAMKPVGDVQYKAWQAENDLLAPLVDSVDAIYPSLYTFYDDQDGWERYARANVAEARRLAKGKPVYPFISMTYHDSNAKLGGQLIPQDYWRRQLNVLREIADGVVIWGGYKMKWDDQAGWWVATRDLLSAQAAACSRPSSPQLRVN